jgi:hypothetical protein
VWGFVVPVENREFLVSHCHSNQLINYFSEERYVVIVKNAGVPEVNGEYHFDRVLYNADCYSRKGNYQGKEVTFGIWRNSSTRFISLCKDMKNPCSDPTLVLFYSGAKSEKLPPLSWCVYNSSYNPLPQVSTMKIDNSILTCDPSRTGETLNSRR